jgi:prepilin-type N-terminal cleavage/methylation domain-containing protein
MRKARSTKFENLGIPARRASEGTCGDEPSLALRVGAPLRTTVAGRAAFTLVEMIVVLAILLTLATITVAFLPTVNNYQKVQSGASRVQAWFLTAKQRALRDQVPRGVRLNVETLGGRQVVRTLQYTEQPEDFSPGALTVVDNNHATVAGTDLSGGFDTTGTDTSNNLYWPVQAGDFLEINSLGPVYRIASVTSAKATPTSNQITTAFTNISNTAGTYPYRIMRAPRALSGEPPLQLPQDVVIDVNGDATASLILSGSTPTGINSYDVLFASSGAVTGVYFNSGSGNTRQGFLGKVILWMKDVTQDAGVGQQVLVTIYTRTGLISVHPVDTANPSNVFDFTTDGKDSGM